MTTGRVNIAFGIESRDGTTASETRLVNAYMEVDGRIRRVVKRPSLEAAFEMPVGSGSFSTLGQALYVWEEVTAGSTTPTTSIVGIRGDSGKKTPDTKGRLFFTVQPSNVSISTAISPSIVVTAKDIFGNTKTGFSGNVTLSFATNRYGASLGGTLTVAAVSGVATFNNVTISESGTGFALKATTSNYKFATSSTFDVSPQITLNLTAAELIATNYMVGYSNFGDIGGSISPSTVASATILRLATINEVLPADDTLEIYMQGGSGENLGQSFFESVVVNGVTYNSSSSIYTYINPQCSWVWTSATPLASAGSYSVAFNI